MSRLEQSDCQHHMEFKQSTIGEILDSEREMVLRGAERYGDFFVNAVAFNTLFESFIKSVDRDRFIFALFLSQVRKHYTLALFSAARLHHVQAMMDLRQVLEAGGCAAYAIANTERADFADADENGILDPSPELTRKRYKWLEENFPQGTAAIKNMKEAINASAAHANIVYAHQTFRMDAEGDSFETPFFDIEDAFFVKSDLWQIANVGMGLMDLFYGVCQKYGGAKFADDFVPLLKKHEAVNHRLKAEMLATERMQKAQRIRERMNDRGAP